jgi:hypothetical protein
VGVLMPYDKAILLAHFPRLGNVFRTPYPLPDWLAETEVCRTQPGKASAGRTVVCGNSGHPNNNHIELIDYARKLDDGETRWLFPLSYGPLDHIALVCGYGNCILGRAFVPLRQTTPLQEYSETIRSAHALVYNHTLENRSQQGMGNICLAMVHGLKVYMRSDSPLYRQLRDWGAIVYDTLQLLGDDKVSFFLQMSEGDRETNRRVLRAHFSEGTALQHWEDAFRATSPS